MGTETGGGERGNVVPFSGNTMAPVGMVSATTQHGIAHNLRMFADAIERGEVGTVEKLIVVWESEGGKIGRMLPAEIDRLPMLDMVSRALNRLLLGVF